MFPWNPVAQQPGILHPSVKISVNIAPLCYETDRPSSFHFIAFNKLSHMRLTRDNNALNALQTTPSLLPTVRSAANIQIPKNHNLIFHPCLSQVNKQRQRNNMTYSITNEWSVKGWSFTMKVVFSWYKKTRQMSTKTVQVVLVVWNSVCLSYIIERGNQSWGYRSNITNLTKPQSTIVITSDRLWNTINSKGLL